MFDRRNLSKKIIQTRKTTAYQYVANNLRSNFSLDWKLPILISSWVPAIFKFNQYDSLLLVSTVSYLFFYIYQKLFFFKFNSRPIMIRNNSLLFT